MCLHVEPFPILPEATARVAKAAFKRKGNIYLTIGDQLGALFDGVDFACLYAADGKPARSPNRLALVTVFQFMENLPDREAADAVRARLDWKYALHLSLEDTGFDALVLSEFRERLAEHALAQEMFEQVLKRLQSLDLVQKGGQQRTDATAVLAATQSLNRVQLVAETMRLALEALSDYRPEWLHAISWPRIITHVATTSTDTREVELIPRIHAALERLDLLPNARWVDTGYTSGPNVINSQQDYGVRLVGPLQEDRSWQARTPGGITLDQFRIDFQLQQATCLQGQVSSRWTATPCEDGSTEVQVAFPSAVCQACAVRELCTKSRTRGRFLQLRGTYAALQAGRQQQQTDAFWEEYRLRAGIEGTISALVRQHGARHTRYIGRCKTEVQALLTAMAVNIRRAALWLMGQRPATTRPPSLRCLAPA